jgi:xanthine dehydrogenase YagS FAD-binding subunit
VRRDYGVLSRALLAGASGQLRNKATTAGNLLQRTRCPYFYDTNQPCNKRQPGSGCGGHRRLQPPARRRRRQRCLHRHPSERHGGAMRVLDAGVETVRPDGATRSIPIADFHRLPGNTPHIENALEPGRADHRGDLPKPVGGGRSTARCATARPMRSRWFRSPPSCSATAAGRVALGGVAHKPWRVEAPKPRCRAAPRPSPPAARRRQADRKRIQAAAGGAHARRGPGRSERLKP